MNKRSEVKWISGQKWFSFNSKWFRLADLKTGRAGSVSFCFSDSKGNSKENFLKSDSYLEFILYTWVAGIRSIFNSVDNFYTYFWNFTGTKMDLF